MSESHLSEETLMDYADDPASVADRSSVEEHLSGYSECWSAVDTYRQIASAMGDEETWWAAEVWEDHGASAVRDFVARIEAEDSEADRLLDPFLDSPYLFLKANIARRKRCHTGGVVRLLCNTARDQVDRDPPFALALAETACVIADSLPDDYYPAAAVNELRGTAWKEYSTACRVSQRFEAAYDALARAERAYRRTIDPDMSLATVSLTRALVLWEQERYTEALPLARWAAAEFSRLRRTVKYFEAKEAEATILHRMGDVDAACETYRAAFELADELADAEMKARAARNLGIAHRDRGDIGMASKYLLVALQLYESLEMRALVVITRWSIARLSLAAGNASDAARRLPEIVADLTALEMRADAAYAHLDLVQALLALGQFEELESVCSDLFAFFRHSQMMTGAMTAAAFLKDAAAARSLTPRLIDHVRKYLAELARTPTLAFAPAPDPPSDYRDHRG